MTTRNWTRDELFLVLNLYSKIPFGQFDKGNREVTYLASLISRTPSAVAMKLTNFASLDTHHQARGVKGLSNASKLDREIWEEVTTNWETFAENSEAMLARLARLPPEDSQVDPSMHKAMPTESMSVTRIRLGQRFFRKMILSAYGSCCVCGIPVPDLLVASHIIPWRDREDLRINPHNGVCLCALHDKAFDQGLMTILPNYHVQISTVISRYLPHGALESGLKNYDGQIIRLPSKFIPQVEFLEVHNRIYFQS